jgi:hypothetical protein
MACLREKMEIQWMARFPKLLAHEQHWRTVITHIEELCNKEKGDRAEVQKETTRMMQKEGSLPRLGAKVPQSPMTRVTTINNQRSYSSLALRKAKSKL